jgi:hypothetical protein
VVQLHRRLAGVPVNVMGTARPTRIPGGGIIFHVLDHSDTLGQTVCQDARRSRLEPFDTSRIAFWAASGPRSPSGN